MRFSKSLRRVGLLAAAAVAASALVGSGPIAAQAETANSSEPAPAPSAAQSEVNAAAATARATGQPVEIESLRSATTATFAQPDGLMRLDQSPVDDTYVASAKPAVSYGDDEQLATGVAPNLKAKFRSYLAFATPALPAGARLVSSELKLFQHSARTCTPTAVTAVPMAESWTSTMTWATQPDYSTTSEYAADASFAHGMNGCQDAYASIDVTKAVKAWHAGTLVNHGLALRADEADASAYKALCSVDAAASPKGQPCATAGRGPVLAVTYNRAPGEPRGRSVTPCVVDCLGAEDRTAVTSSTSPALGAAAHDADGGLLRYDFEVWKGNVTSDVSTYPETACAAKQTHAKLVAAAQTTDSYPSSSGAAWTVPAGTLTDGGSYVYRVRAFDGVACGPWSTETGGWVRFSVGEPNALRHKAIATMDGWAGWLADNNVRGHVGEVGWPRDDARWSPIAQAWYDRSESHSLGVTTWVTGDWAGGHQLANFVRSAQTNWKWTTSLSSDVMEANPGTAQAPHGVNVTGPDMGAASIEPTHTFSNENVGILDQKYHYDEPASLQFLATHNMEVIRIPFRWERMQRSLYGELDAAELGRLRKMVRDVAATGLPVILDMHNYGQYYLSDGTKGVRRSLGSPELPISAFTDAWTKLATALAAEPNVYAFGLMNEPTAMPTTTVSPQKLWEQASQAAVTAIRDTGETRIIMVGGYDWSGMKNWATLHPVAWIDDPAGNVMYEAHQYWNSNNSGVYMSYDAELAAAEAQGW